MKVIIPMAGMGKRLRPHTLTTPKPLFPIAGKPIVQRLVEDIAAIAKTKIDVIAFVVGDFGKAVEQQLLDIAATNGSKGKIYYQQEALGTAHAILCAKESLDDELIIAFADTLFEADFTLDKNKDGVIWVKSVEDPRNFGVVKLDKNKVITELVEKPQTFVSDLAIIGIYYIKNGSMLKKEMEYLVQNNIRTKGEYQLTDALSSMTEKGLKFAAGEVKTWMDCGNKEAVLDTNQKILNRQQTNNTIAPSAQVKNSVVIAPSFIGENVVVENAVIGPYVSIGSKSHVRNTVIQNSIVREECRVENCSLDNTILGNNVVVQTTPESLNLGDFSVK